MQGRVFLLKNCQNRWICWASFEI